MARGSVEDLIRELEENKTLLSIRAYSEYKRNGVIIRSEKADTGFVYDRKLILSDGSEVVAWL